jgi:hypothetical protein
LADVLNDLFVKRVVAMAEVQARHVHTGLNQTFKNFLGRTGGTNSANDLGSTHLVKIT